MDLAAVCGDVPMLADKWTRRLEQCAGSAARLDDQTLSRDGQRDGQGANIGLMFPLQDSLSLFFSSSHVMDATDAKQRLATRPIRLYTPLSIHTMAKKCIDRLARTHDSFVMTEKPNERTLAYSGYIDRCVSAYSYPHVGL